MRTTVVLICLSLFFSSHLAGQISIDVGYTGSAFLPNKFRPIISSFNSYLPDNARKMKTLNYMNGLYFGISSSELPVNINIEYNGTYASISAKRLIASDGSQYNYIFNHSNNAIGGGLIFDSGKRLKLGGALLYNFMSFKKLTTNDDKRLILKNAQSISVKPYLDISLGDESDRVNASLRLFGNFLFSKTDITNVYNALDPEGRTAYDSNDLKTKLNTYGITLILHNRRY